MIQVRPVNPDGTEIDYTKTAWYHQSGIKERLDDGFFDNHMLALLTKGENGWVFVEYEFGATDYSGQDWLEQHHVDSLFR